MTLMNLYGVTNSLLNLLALNVSLILNEELNEAVAIPRSDLIVTSIAPERIENPNNTLSLFLYHVAEDPYYKNVLGPGNDVPNVAKTPMALNLFYILTTHHEVDPDFDAQTQQKLMGYALKTFHDFPVITDQTEIATIPVLDEGLRGNGNTLQVILRPVSAEDAITFWSSEDTRTARLSAYYEVRVVMLDPEPPKTMPGIVLNLGTYLLQLGSPHLDTSQSLIFFQLPARNGGTVQSVEAFPARITLNHPLNPIGTRNQLILRGTHLTTGIFRSLGLQNRLWNRLLPPLSGNTSERITVDLAENPNWQIEFMSDQIIVTLASSLTHLRPNNTLVNLPLFPGFYSVFLRAIVSQPVINGELKPIVASSNEIGFAIAPRIIGHEAPDNGIININLDLDLNLVEENQLEDEIQVIVAGEVYTRTDTDPPASEREFWIDTPMNRIRLNPHFPVAVNESTAYPFRLIVNGAESAPFWIELNPP